ncbi:type II toxin-antitoxin system VapC family toxin [Paracoccaceae bacterium Fryx2]|nr:type II toxin-antitoxin system VapC family toxin [Paracoccaceae bacterium Fryx2]
MIIIDTNVVSELMRAKPDPAVLAWFAGHAADTLFLTAVSEAELRTGAAILPAGQRRDRLVGAIGAMIDQDFAGRILPFDSPAARCYAEIAAARRGTGKPIMDADCQIAAIALACNAAIATRNVKDFEGCGGDIINPWNSV